MPYFLKRLCLSGFITIILLIGSVCWNPFEFRGADYFVDHVERAYAMDAHAAGKNDPQTNTQIEQPTQSAVREMIFGVFLSIIGLAAIALSFLRWKTNDLSLISFGAFCFLYGARAEALHFLFNVPRQHWVYVAVVITYLVPIPCWIFVEQFLGKGWKSSIRRLWQCQIAISIAAILVDSLLHSPGKAMIANSIMASTGILVVLSNLFKPGLEMTRELRVLISGLVIFATTALHANIAPWFTEGHESSNLEWLGLLIFICCLVYVVAYRFFLYTDGIVEASNMADELFGWDRFKEYIATNSGLPAHIFTDKLIEDLTRWSAKGSTATLDDDLTLVVVDVESAA